MLKETNSRIDFWAINFKKLKKDLYNLNYFLDYFVLPNGWDYVRLEKR